MHLLGENDRLRKVGRPNLPSSPSQGPNSNGSEALGLGATVSLGKDSNSGDLNIVNSLSSKGVGSANLNKPGTPFGQSDLMRLPPNSVGMSDMSAFLYSDENPMPQYHLFPRNFPMGNNGVQSLTSNNGSSGSNGSISSNHHMSMQSSSAMGPMSGLSGLGMGSMSGMGSHSNLPFAPSQLSVYIPEVSLSNNSTSNNSESVNSGEETPNNSSSISRHMYDQQR